MAKEKPRHDPRKTANLMGKICQFSDEINGKLVCNHGENINICKGNPHNCVKVTYQKEASKRR